MRARVALLVLAGSAALGGCAYGYGDYGGLSVGVSSGYGGYGGYGYDPYGYGSYGYDPYGYGSGYGYDPYGYGSYYGGYGQPYFGWYNDYYYPGTGYYVYDQYRRPQVWSDSQKRYWTERRERVLSQPTVTSRIGVNRERMVQQRGRPELRENWSSFKTRPIDGRASNRGQQSGNNQDGNRD